MIQFAMPAASTALNFMGGLQASKAARRQAEFEAQVIEAQGQQALYDAMAKATIAEFNRKREVQDTGIEEASIGRQFRTAGKNAAASYLSRGIDPSAAFSALAVEKERTFQEIGYRSSKLQANLTSEARLAEHYGQLAKRQSRVDATNTRALGAAKAKSLKNQAVIGLVKDVVGMGQNYGGDLMSAFSSMFSSGEKSSSSDFRFYDADTGFSGSVNSIFSRYKSGSTPLGVSREVAGGY